LRQAADYIETLDSVGWFSNNSNGAIHPVGEKKPNAFGLHDMHGNVWEWCLDQVEQNKGGMLESCRPGATDPLSPNGDWRTLKGGCFSVNFDRCRSAYRGANAPEVKRNDRGFRIVLGPVLEEDDQDPNKDPLPNPPDLKTEEKRALKNLQLTLLPIPAGSFLKGSPGSLRSMRAVISTDGQLLAHVNIKGRVEVVRLSDKTVVASTPKLPSRVNAIDLSPDGKMILTGSRDGISRLWDAKTGQLLRDCKGHSAAVVSVAFSPDGKRFATGGLDGSCRFWDSATGKTSLILKDSEARFRRLSFGPEGKRLLTSGPGAKPILWNCRNGQRIIALNVDPEQVTSARFSPNGSFAAVTTRSNRIHLCELTTGLPINSIRQHAGEIADLAFSPNARTLLTINLDNVLRIHRVPLNWSIIVFDRDGTSTRSPDYFFTLTGSSRISSRATGLYLERWLTEQGRQPQDAPMAHSSDNKWTLTHTGGALRLWRAETGALHAVLADKLKSPVARSAFSPDNRIALAQLATGEILAYPSVDWKATKPDEEWNDLLETLEGLDADKARSWLHDAINVKP
jgi:WD40 repeat protein